MSIDLIPDSDAILKILSVDFCGKLKQIQIPRQNCARIQNPGVSEI